MAEIDEAGMTRYWVDFDLPPAPTYAGVVIDGDTPLRRALARGVGVTALDADDAVALIARWLVNWNVISAPGDVPRVARLGFAAGGVDHDRVNGN